MIPASSGKQSGKHVPDRIREGNVERSTPEKHVDWEGIEHSSEFQELVTRRRRFVLPATIFFLAYYTAFILLAGYAPDFMGSSLYQGLTVGYTLALTQFVMVFGLGIAYLRKSEREFDPLAQRVRDYAADSGDAADAAPPRRSEGRDARPGAEVAR